MTYATLLVHLELGRPNDAVLAAAGDLSQRFGSRVVGVAGAQPMQVAYGNGFLTGQIIQQQYQEIDAETQVAEAAFRTALASKATALEWRPAVSFALLSDYIAAEARCADLVVTGVGRSAARVDSARHLDTGELAMRAGRPLFIVPPEARRVAFGHVMVGWKDTAVTRRAVYDALPLLRTAERVTIVEIAPQDDLDAARGRLADVASWLAGHNIAARTLAEPSLGDDSVRVSALAEELEADVIVAGAYGHSRLREWMMGGVTRELLLHPRRCTLVAH